METKGESLLTKYRPTFLDQVYGQDDAVRSIEALLRSDSMPHSFMFSGIPGVGKTSLARIIGTCLDAEIIEIDAASNSGVDSMKSIIAQCLYKPIFGGFSNKLLIIDEAQRLSKQALESSLKIIEEPPSHLFFAFCTTEPEKILKSIQSRCVKIQLKPVRSQDIIDLLKTVADIEGYTIAPDILETIAICSEGSPRMALSLLAVAWNAKTPKDVESFALQESQRSDLMNLANLILQGGSWKDIQSIYNSLSEDDVERGIYVIGETLFNAYRKASNTKEAIRLHQMLESLWSLPVEMPNKVRLGLFLGRIVLYVQNA